MDRISESLLNEFSSEHGIRDKPEDERFEHFASYITIHRDFSETFDTSDLVVGKGGDTGIDAIAMIVNGVLISDVESLEEMANDVSYLDVLFIFVQAERSANFETAKIGGFGYGVTDFFSDAPRLTRNDKVANAAEIMRAVFNRSSKFSPGNPVCRLYYVTTGIWANDHDLESRRKSAVADLEQTHLFRLVEFFPVDQARLQALYQQSRNAIARDFNFPSRVVIPDVAGVTQAYLGFLPAKEYLRLIKDDSDEIIDSLFYDNVRDWQGDEGVNSEIKSTLASGSRGQFILMNNGITIIARTLQPTGNRLFIEDYQIVNGCQTSHVLSTNRTALMAA